jgi:putative intracellular protease/amidase
MKDPSSFANALQIKDTAAIQRLSKSWIYSGYTMTVFSTKEEQQEEPGQDNVLGGYLKMYPDEALDFAGGKVLVRAQKWQSNVVRDRELLTGQNPFSDKAFAKTLVEMLEE